MNIIIGLLLLIAAQLHAEVSISPTTTVRNPDETDEEILAKISSSCLSRQDHEQLTGGTLRYSMARHFNSMLLVQAHTVIGLAELRSVAGFKPAGPWTAYRRPTDDEIAAASTIDEYYELREPRSGQRSTDNENFFEWNVPPAVKFFS